MTRDFDFLRVSTSGGLVYFVSATTSFATSHGQCRQELIAGLNHGFSMAFWFGALFVAAGAVVAFFGMKQSHEADLGSLPTGGDAKAT